MLRQGPPRTHYDVLGIKADCSAEDVKRAYRKLAMETHPDATQGESADFLQISEAFNVLSDPYRRFLYDDEAGIKAMGPPASASASSRSPAALKSAAAGFEAAGASVWRSTNAVDRESPHFFRARGAVPRNEADRRRRVKARVAPVKGTGTLARLFVVPIVGASLWAVGFFVLF